jgi:hypothetical protein
MELGPRTDSWSIPDDVCRCSRKFQIQQICCKSMLIQSSDYETQCVSCFLCVVSVQMSCRVQIQEVHNSRTFIDGPAGLMQHSDH